MSSDAKLLIRKIRPALVGFSASESAAIEYFLRRKLSKTPVPAEQANCFIVNGDRYSSLTQLKNDYPKAPQGVVLGLSKHQWVGYRWLGKPYSSEALLQALEAVATGIEVQPVGSEYEVSGDFSIDQQNEALKAQLEAGDLTVNAADRLLAQLGGQKKSALAEMVASIVVEDTPAGTQVAGTGFSQAELDSLFCGSMDDVDLDNMKERQQVTFNPDGYILNLLKHLVNKGEEIGSAVLLKGEQVQIVYLPASAEFVHAYEDAQLSEIAQRRFRFGELLIETPAEGALDEFIASSRQIKKIAFLWLLALASSRGRLLVGMDPHKAYVLRLQPDSGHFPSLDCFHQIADIWFNHSLSVVDIIRILDLPQRQVFAFASAAFFLDWLDAEGQAG